MPMTAVCTIAASMWWRFNMYKMKKNVDFRGMTVPEIISLSKKSLSNVEDDFDLIKIHEILHQMKKLYNLSRYDASQIDVDLYFGKHNSKVELVTSSYNKDGVIVEHYDITIESFGETTLAAKVGCIVKFINGDEIITAHLLLEDN